MAPLGSRAMSHSRTRVASGGQQYPGVVVQDTSVVQREMLLTEARNRLLVFYCLYRLMGRHRGADAVGGQLPRGHRREQAMILIGLVIIIGVLMVLAVPRIRGMLSEPDASRKARSPAPRTQER